MEKLLRECNEQLKKIIAKRQQLMLRYGIDPVDLADFEYEVVMAVLANITMRGKDAGYGLDERELKIACDWWWQTGGKPKGQQHPL
jgi:hypothetical protein